MTPPRVDILAAIRDLDWELTVAAPATEEADETCDLRLEPKRLCAAELWQENLLLNKENTAIRADASRLYKSNVYLKRRLDLISCAAFFTVAATALAWVVWMVRE
jgi:hypothetical protein